MGKTWVLPSFKHILIDFSEEYLNKTDKGKDKARSALVTTVAHDIRDAVKDTGDSLPDELEKSIRTWFQNEAAGYAKGDGGKSSKDDTRGHPTSKRSWTAKTVCGKIHYDRVAEVQTRLSGGGEKNISQYNPALSEVFTALSADEKSRCETLANEWNSAQPPEHIQRKLSKKIPSDVAEWTQYMQNKTGAVFFILGAYTDEDGRLSFARYETDGLDFISTRNEYRKGPNNITDVWTKFIEDKEEMEDHGETLELDEDGYPHLPDDILKLRLHKKKAILRQYMGAVRRYFKLTGRIPWADIADNPSRHLSNRSCPDSDHRLADPSHMKAQGVDDWLKHWFKLQKKNKRPLTLKDQSKAESNATVKRPRGKGKQRAEPEDSDNEWSDIEDVANDDESTGTVKPSESSKANRKGEAEPEDPADEQSGGEDAVNDDEPATTDPDANGDTANLPPAPCSVGRSTDTRRAFLESLSEDRNYRLLIRLLDAANAGPLIGTPGPNWASWASNNRFLPKAFYRAQGAGSLSQLKSWLQSDPITTVDGSLASYSSVELVILAIGLAMRDLYVNQFPDGIPNIPVHVINSRFELHEYEHLSHNVEDLLNGYQHLYDSLYPHTIDDVADHINRLAQLDKAFPTTDTSVNDRQIHKGCQPGLASVPASLQHLRDDVGLVGKSWEQLGKKWQSLAVLWRRADALLAKTGRGDLLIKEIRASTLPITLKDWLYSKIMHTDASAPEESFGKEYTYYLERLPWNTMTKGDAVLAEVWCRSGKTGIIVLLLGLHWQAVYSGAGKKWNDNLSRVEKIFHAILDAPTLQRSKRNRAESSGVGSEHVDKRTRK